MPVLQITDGRGQLAGWAPLRVVALLVHPDNEQARDTLFETLAAGALVVAESGVGEGVISRLIDRELGRALSDVAVGCAIAGDLLLWILSAAAYEPRAASLRRAVTVWARDHALAKDSLGRPVPASARYLKRMWARYKPVAHLAAALQIHIDLGPNSGLDPTCLSMLPFFLGAAEALRIAAETHHPPVGRSGSRPSLRPLLDPERTWRLPTDLKLPTVALRVPPVTAHSQEWLAGYRSHND